ncbi:nuclear mRNA export, poly(A)+RNA binding protein [Neophaeococcomyces mojaviensis]|uniref:Nuclear mRNA export, poly(A)+RNA binding protein n=1 Tax=Neophaeococcomyces mojaviensis TaxID=3383035 RepID=A0ACC2ZYV4_9EURO|nr:nuclear mRNA export, poly(A)+RNA binding protein [Knufia sp. JES_112]
MAPPPNSMETDNQVILSISGWTNSKASSSNDRGASSLKTWLEGKAKRSIIDYQVTGDVLQIAVAGRDKGSFTRINGYRWAGIDLNIVEGQLDAPPPGPRNQPAPAGPRNQQNSFNQNRNSSLDNRISGHQSGPFGQNRNQGRDLFDQHPPSGPRGGFAQKGQPNGNTPSPFAQNNTRNQEPSVREKLEQALVSVIQRRYHPVEKFLDLSALALDADIQASGLAQSSAEKVFTALFRVCEEKVWPKFHERRQQVESLSFKDNSLASVKDIIAAASTFSKIKNLDLSNNRFSQITDLTWWRRRFPDLEQIILAGNPVDSAQTREEVRKWYRNLKTYNMLPLDAPLAGSLQPQLEINPPVPTPSPIPGAGPNGQILTPEPHPEFPPGSTFGLPTPDKPEDQVIKEQMGLKFSFETRLKMKWVEQCLVANNFNYDAAMDALHTAMNDGSIPADAFLQV